MKRTTVFAAAALLAASAMQAGLPLKIYRGDNRTDTVSSSSYYLIGVTDPSAKAKIEGKDAHVYKTGSFGAKVELNEGENMIPVSVRKGTQSLDTLVRVVVVPRKRSVASEAATEPMAEPLNIVTKAGAYLQYGNGGDRLGGSKMGYIDEGIGMTAVGQTAGLYKVALGQKAFAYIPKSSVAAGGVGAKTVNTGSASIFNIGKADRIVLNLPTRLPYWSRAEIDPQTIRVSVYGAMNNSNWITQRNALGIIDFVDFQQTESDVLTLVIRLKDNYQWGYSIGYQGNNLTIDIRHRPASLEISDLTIGLDAGHGGPYPGAISPSGLTEKEVNLDIILKVADRLRKMGAKVVLTRDGDTGPSMTERKEIWKNAGVDIAISVHNNSSGNPLVPMGTSAYYKHINNRALASCLHQSLLTLGIADFGLTGNFNFSLNGPTDYPNALVEVLFMSSLPEEEMLADEAYRTKLADKIVDGLTDYLNKAKN